MGLPWPILSVTTVWNIGETNDTNMNIPLGFDKKSINSLVMSSKILTSLANTKTVFSLIFKNSKLQRFKKLSIINNKAEYH